MVTAVRYNRGTKDFIYCGNKLSMRQWALTHCESTVKPTMRKKRKVNVRRYPLK